jgi:hypothetical protein
MFGDLKGRCAIRRIKITKGKCTDRNTFANDKGVECLKAYLEEEWAQDSAAGVKKADF